MGGALAPAVLSFDCSQDVAGALAPSGRLGVAAVGVEPLLFLLAWQERDPQHHRPEEPRCVPEGTTPPVLQAAFVTQHPVQVLDLVAAVVGLLVRGGAMGDRLVAVEVFEAGADFAAAAAGAAPGSSDCRMLADSAAPGPTLALAGIR